MSIAANRTYIYKNMTEEASLRHARAYCIFGLMGYNTTYMYYCLTYIVFSTGRAFPLLCLSSYLLLYFCMNYHIALPEHMSNNAHIAQQIIRI